jgi:hypothetical protein
MRSPKTKKVVAKKAATKKKAPTKKNAVPQPVKKVAAKGKTITKEIAQRYLKDSSAVDLSAFTRLDDKAADVLGRSDCWLHLSGVTHLSDAAAKSLAGCKGGLELDGLTEVSDSVAQCLAKNSSCLSLNGLTSLADRLARIMATHSGWKLEINGVTSLSDETARHLSGRKQGGLELQGVTSVSDTAAKWLASCKSDLELGIGTLSDASAKAFASFPEKLRLPGLRTLSDVAAKSLEKLDADGRLEVSDRLCKTMKRLKDHCHRWHGRLRYRGWKLDEKKVKWKDVPDKARDVLDNAFEYGVNRDKVKITRLTLTALKGSQKHEYFVGYFESSDMDIGWTYVVNDKAVVAEDEYD